MKRPELDAAIKDWACFLESLQRLNVAISTDERRTELQRFVELTNLNAVVNLTTPLTDAIQRLEKDEGV